MLLPILALGAVSFVISWLATAAMIRIAPKLGFVDKPGGRKIHANPKPLGGGVAMFIGFALPMLVGLAIVRFYEPDFTRWAWIEPYWTGGRKQAPLVIGLLCVMLVMHVMGLIDDHMALGPYIKLVLQLASITGLILTMEWFAQTTPSLRLRALTTLDKLGLGIWPSVVLTVLWITAITNAFNFLDNMDGLSAGVAAVCAIAFFITAVSIHQWFVAATLALLIGSLLGFLFWNFPPAKIFMGDSGSLLIGLVLGVLTVRTTYLAPGQDFGAGWYAVFAPVIVLALPLYDLVVVSIIRLSRGKSPFQGDTNHFSHRLVARGMSRRTAVLCLYLVTAATSVAAIVLPHVHSMFAAMLIFAQTLLVLGLVALLEQHPLPTGQQ
jgi:UDP-GlcNAc:undecaprenyl-phosphate GlcNAc-1-phosphate transferase